MASERPSRLEEELDSVPCWIVSFSDMVTLLLAFFVLLQAFAKEQHEELFFAGQGSFKRAISGLGIPDYLYGKPFGPRMKARKTWYSTEEDPNQENTENVKDFDDDKIRNLFKQMQNQLDSQTSDRRTKPLLVRQTNAEFAKGSWQLGPKAISELANFAAEVRENRAGTPISIYVVGLAPDEPDGPRRWVLSARRAREAQKSLSRQFKREIEDNQWRVLSWGAGSGVRLGQEIGVVAENSYLVMIVMSDEE